MGLESLIMDYCFLIGGSAADNACTYVTLNKLKGHGFESNTPAQKKIKKYGLGEGLLRHFGSSLGYLAAGTLMMYGIDCLFGIEDHIANFHHAFVYITGTTKYIAAIHNVSVAYQCKIIPKAIEYIPYFFSKGLSNVTAPIIGQKFEDPKPETTKEIK